MDKTLTILLIEDEPVECMAFAQYVDSIDDVRLVEVTNNADKALEYAKDYLPDVIILDLELHKGSGNGITFLMALGKASSQILPYILVTTQNISHITHNQVRLLGADFIMVKNQEGYSAKTVVDFLRSIKGTIHDSRYNMQSTSQDFDGLSPNEKKKRLFARVSAEIDQIGISPKAVGRRYLVDAIMLNIDGLTDHVTAIAQKYSKSDASVERAMQNAINSTWRNGDIEDLERNYTARIVSEKGVPTLNEFVYYFANKMKIEY